MNRLLNETPGQAPRFVVIVSDAIESCVTMRGVRLAQPKTEMRATMVIVPSTAGGRRLSAWQGFELRKKNWGETVPWLEMVPIPLLTGAVFVPGHRLERIYHINRPLKVMREGQIVQFWGRYFPVPVRKQKTLSSHDDFSN
jgi:hypothetical protein